jgi:hypothetical protein
MENRKIEINVSNGLKAISFWFISSLFIWWGWSVLAPHLNAPMFNYWEIFAIRMMFSCSINIIAKSFIN